MLCSLGYSLASLGTVQTNELFVVLSEKLNLVKKRHSACVSSSLSPTGTELLAAGVARGAKYGRTGACFPRGYIMSIREKRRAAMSGPDRNCQDL